MWVLDVDIFGLEKPKNLKKVDRKLTEEIEFLEKLPGMKTYIPGGPEETRNIILKSYQEPGPAYIRL